MEGESDPPDYSTILNIGIPEDEELCPIIYDGCPKTENGLPKLNCFKSTAHSCSRLKEIVEEIVGESSPKTEITTKFCQSYLSKKVWEKIEERIGREHKDEQTFVKYAGAVNTAQQIYDSLKEIDSRRRTRT